MRCVALLSGGLDSQLAVRLMTKQGIEVDAINIRTQFECCQHKTGEVARRLGVRLTVLPPEPEYLTLIQEPRFGYGRAANPCVDCRIYMFQRAKSFMEQIGADFVVTGEVVGQRPMSQKRADLDIIAYHSGLHDLLLRPLSAKLLPPTVPEQRGWVDPDLLYEFWGRGRKRLIALARELGLTEIPMPSTGCALTEKSFGRKVFDLMQHQRQPGPWDYELLKHGRHFRRDQQCKVVVGRREAENELLERLAALPESSTTAVLTPEGFRGPAALVIGPPTEDNLRYAASLMLRYGKVVDGQTYHVQVALGDRVTPLSMSPDSEAAAARTLAMPRR